MNESSQGGTLDLHHESGLKAIKDAGLMREFKAYPRFEGDATKFQAKIGKVYFNKLSNNAKSEDDRYAQPGMDRYVYNLRYRLML